MREIPPAGRPVPAPENPTVVLPPYPNPALDLPGDEWVELPEGFGGIRGRGFTVVLPLADAHVSPGPLSGWLQATIDRCGRERSRRPALAGTLGFAVVTGVLALTGARHHVREVEVDAAWLRRRNAPVHWPDAPDVDTLPGGREHITNCTALLAGQCWVFPDRPRRTRSGTVTAFTLIAQGPIGGRVIGRGELLVAGPRREVVAELGSGEGTWLVLAPAPDRSPLALPAWLSRSLVVDIVRHRLGRLVHQAVTEWFGAGGRR